MPHYLHDQLREIRDKLAPVAGEDFALREAETIIEHVYGISRTQLYTASSSLENHNCVICHDKNCGDENYRAEDHRHNKNCRDKIALIDEIVERRLLSEPLQYILGSAYFYDREIIVDSNVLIPRCDTEILVETIFSTEKKDRAKFIDIGTGSGILAVVLIANRPMWNAVAVDVSFDALKVAAKNCRRLKNINLLCADLLSALKPENQFDFIVSNPPYISAEEYNALDKSVVDYEPRAALVGGDDGLDYYRAIIGGAKNYLADCGKIYFEIGYDQAKSVSQILRDCEFVDINIIKDLGGRNRVVYAAKKT